MTNVASNGNPQLQANSPSPSQTTTSEPPEEPGSGGDGSWLRQVDVTLREQIEARPYVVLGAAVGLGWLLGRGLSTPVGKAVSVVAGRYLIKQLIGV